MRKARMGDRSVCKRESGGQADRYAEEHVGGRQADRQTADRMRTGGQKGREKGGGQQNRQKGKRKVTEARRLSRRTARRKA